MNKVDILSDCIVCRVSNLSALSFISRHLYEKHIAYHIDADSYAHLNLFMVYAISKDVALKDDLELIIHYYDKKSEEK